MSRIEIARTDDGWHARVRASNGRIVWWTETYTRRRGALNAVRILDGALPGRDLLAAVTDVDERTVR